MAVAASAENSTKRDASSTAHFCAHVQRVGEHLAIVLSEITRTFERCGVSIWSEAFRPDQLPMAFVHDGPDGHPVCWAYNLTLPVAVLGQIAVDDTGQLTAYDGSGIERVEVGFEIGRELAGHECVLFDLDGQSPSVTESEFRRFVIHETFHFFQLFVECWRTPVGFDPFSEVEHLPIDEFLGDLEVELLESAVIADDDDEFALLVGRFCRIRSHRHSSQTRALLMSQEDGLEQIEGTARYVENRYAAANGLPARLELPPEATDSRSDWHSAGRFYRTGARIGEILDRLDIDWRHRLAFGVTPALILCEAEHGGADGWSEPDEGESIDLHPPVD